METAFIEQFPSLCTALKFFVKLGVKNLGFLRSLIDYRIGIGRALHA